MVTQPTPIRAYRATPRRFGWRPSLRAPSRQFAYSAHCAKCRHAVRSAGTVSEMPVRGRTRNGAKAQEAFAAGVLLEPEDPDPDEDEDDPDEDEDDPDEDDPAEDEDEPLPLEESEDFDSDFGSDLDSALTSEDEPPGTPAPARLSVR